MTEPISVTISAETAEMLAFESDSTVFNGWTKVASVEGDESRWSRNYTLVLKDPDGLFWGIDYSVGATEEQENDMPWQGVDHDHQIEPTRLYPQTVTRVEYRTTPAEVNG